MSEGRTPLLEMRGVSKTFPGVVALDKLSLKIKSDSFQVKASNTARPSI